MSLGSRGITFRWFQHSKCIALFRHKIVLVPDLGRLVYRLRMYVHSSAAAREIHFSSGAALPQKNTSVQNNHLRFHTMT